MSHVSALVFLLLAATLMMAVGAQSRDSVAAENVKHCLDKSANVTDWLNCAQSLVDECVRLNDGGRIEKAGCVNDSYYAMEHIISQVVTTYKSSKLNAYLDRATEGVRKAQKGICSWGPDVFVGGTDAIDQPGECRWRILAE